MSVRPDNIPLMPIRAKVDNNFVWDEKENGRAEMDKGPDGSYFNAKSSFCLKCGHAFDLRRFVDFINDPKHLCPDCKKKFDIIMRTKRYKEEVSEELWPNYYHGMHIYVFDHDDDHHGKTALKHQTKPEHKQPVQLLNVLRPSPLPRAPQLLRSPVVGRQQQQQQQQPQSGNYYYNNTPTQHYWPGPVRQQPVYYHNPNPQPYYR